MNKFIIITTINERTEALRKFEAMSGWKSIIVGDQKTPQIDDSDSLEFLSVEKQKTLGLQVVDRLPYNHYTRKNIGYLYAISQGADLIYETDDDNIPYDTWAFDDFSCERSVSCEGGFLNAYRHFTSAHIWPRGFPLDEILEHRPVSEKTGGVPSRVGVWQSLADREPDVDAIYRLVIGKNVTFEANPPISLAKGTYCPFNSQNTLWTPEAYGLLYLPATVRFRFTDILRGYVAQRVLWEMDMHLGFCAATVYQDRNAHNLISDFADELDCYLRVKPIVDLMNKLPLGAGPLEDLRTIYQSLVDNDFVSAEELKIVDAWISDFRSVSTG